MMDEVAVSARGLSKMYKVYRRRPYRLAEFFGLRLGDTRRYFEEYWALQDVTLDIARGSTVGVIGRNGAGKSTFLKLLSGTCVPSRGEVSVKGRVSVLLELGAGFHPDLTGHESIFASGLYLGLDRHSMEELYEEIVTFAELGEFLHQPVRTYSAGMYLRLAFSVATSIQADVQVIDEVLGVGDAYFFGKCVDRFRRLQAEGRTTILVSHDHATVLRLCSRCLWIDGGKIVADGAPLEVIMAYNQSVYEERDRAEGSAAGSGADLRDGHTLRKSGAVCIEKIEFLKGISSPTQVFSMGDPMTVRVYYRSLATLSQPVVSATVYRLDGVTVCNAISSLDGAQMDLVEGAGAIELIFDRLLLGPGEYQIVIGVYPCLDLRGSASPQHAVIWRHPRTFSVRQPEGVLTDLGVVRHPVRWRVVDQRPVRMSVGSAKGEP